MIECRSECMIEYAYEVFISVYEVFISVYEVYRPYTYMRCKSANIYELKLPCIILCIILLYYVLYHVLYYYTMYYIPCSLHILV
jgi:hypothetical protein